LPNEVKIKDIIQKHHQASAKFYEWFFSWLADISKDEEIQEIKDIHEELLDVADKEF